MSIYTHTVRLYGVRVIINQSGRAHLQCVSINKPKPEACPGVRLGAAALRQPGPLSRSRVTPTWHICARRVRSTNHNQRAQYPLDCSSIDLCVRQLPARDCLFLVQRVSLNKLLLPSRIYLTATSGRT